MPPADREDKKEDKSTPDKRAANIPSVSLLKATHVFPGTYTMKAIGLSEGAFVARVIAAAREELQLDADPPYTTRESEKKSHIAITLELPVLAAEQVEDVYKRLLSVPGLQFLL